MSIGRRLLSGGGAAMLVATTLTVVAWAPGSIASAEPAPCHMSPCSFASTGTEQTFVVPARVTSITATVIGAPGSGEGGAITGNIKVTPGETLYLEVGTAGQYPVPPGNPQAGGLGGTAGASASGGNGGSYNASGGGGASDIRTVSAPVKPSIRSGRAVDATDSLNSRIVVAGGGGGGNYGGSAGAAGGNSNPSTGGGAGGTTGGTAGAGDLPGSAGTLGIGGAGGEGQGDGGGGGGGGFYGGGAGGGTSNMADGSGGGGGSSAIDTGSGLKLAIATATAAAPSIKLTWTAPPALVSTVTLAASGGTQFYGTSSVTLTATVHSAGFKGGQIVFKSGSKTLASVAETTGTATFAVPAKLAVGRTRFTAVFIPTHVTGVRGSTSAGVFVTVVAPASSLALTANKPVQKNGVSSVVLTAVVSVNDHGSTAGRVAFLRDARVFRTETVVAGKATFEVPAAIGVGKSKFFAVFTSSRAGVVGSTSKKVTITITK